MKAENNIKIMVWAIIILVIMNLSTIITVIYNQDKSSTDISKANQVSVMSESASMKFSGRYFRDQLELSNNQMNRFVEFNPIFRQKAQDINHKLVILRTEMLTVMNASNSDTAYLNNLSDSIGSLHSQLKKLTYRYYLDIKNICDSQQQEKLNQLFNEIFSTDIQLGHFGGANKMVEHRGRQINN